MLTITVPGSRMLDEKTNKIFTVPTQELKLEHSLRAISEWESKYKKPFQKTLESGIKRNELIDYFRCMTQNTVDPNIYYNINSKIVDEILTYMQDSQTATTINNKGKKPPKRRTLTAELVYGWMVSYGIPFECDQWHINKLLMLIKVCGELDNPAKPSKKGGDAARAFAQLNAKRRAANKSRG